ncbi:MAG: hypothetical protein FK733_04355 [Asgard group archaeon]|nr:hypothetical protein [Asgard group archaeon]
METSNIAPLEKKAPKVEIIVTFSIINTILLGGLILFILALTYGQENWDWGGNLAAGVYGIFIMVGAGIADIIAIIVVLIIRAARKK